MVPPLLCCLPMASVWWDIISGSVYWQDMRSFIEELCYTPLVQVSIMMRKPKIYRERSWKGRAGGRYVSGGGNRVIEQTSGDKVIFSLRYPAEDWQEWAKTLGHVVRTGIGQGYRERRQHISLFRTKRSQRYCRSWWFGERRSMYS